MQVFAIINKNCQFVRNNSNFTEAFFTNLFNDYQINAKVVLVDATEISDLVKKIVAEKHDDILLVVGGGDGTVSSVANLLVGKKVTLGILPLGTLNHFAKDLNIPLDIEECMELFKSGKVKNIDVACINDRHFINNASIGFYPRLVKERDKQMRWFKLGKFSAMFLSAINIFQRFPVYNVKIITNDQYFELKTPLVFIGNNEYELTLFKFKSRKSLENGQLCVYMLKCKNRFQFLKLLFYLAIGILNQSRDFIEIFTKELTLEAKRAMVSVGLDGEIVYLSNPLDCKIQPKSLTVCSWD